jgi:hypothetical protein
MHWRVESANQNIADPSLFLCQRLGSLIKRPFNYTAIEEVGTSGDGVKQRLDLVHTTAASIQLPPRALERDCPLRGISDILIPRIQVASA